MEGLAHGISLVAVWCSLVSSPIWPVADRADTRLMLLR